MALATEIEKVREVIKEVEDPAVAMALRHICKAFDMLQEETPAIVAREKEREIKSGSPH
ncbi:MAG: hypothetical protein WCY68_03510 [Desulfuromonadales bacterium]